MSNNVTIVNCGAAGGISDPGVQTTLDQQDAVIAQQQIDNVAADQAAADAYQAQQDAQNLFEQQAKQQAEIQAAQMAPLIQTIQDYCSQNDDADPAVVAIAKLMGIVQ